jgi:hypothetical protein
MKRAIRRWIKVNIRARPRVRSCRLIGSILSRRNGFDDVDIVLVLDAWNVRRWLPGKKAAFHLVFG